MTTNPRSPAHSADPDHAFDLQPGMAVYDANGETIGRVIAIVGFGSTKVRRLIGKSTELVTQAKTGSGYFTVDRQEILGPGAEPLTVPFHGIGEVELGRGVCLNERILEQLRHQRDPRPAKEREAPVKRRTWWPRWL